LAEAPFRRLAGEVGHPVDVDSAASVSYLHRLRAGQHAVAKRIERTIPGSSVRWHYSVVLDGMAVVVPRGKTAELTRVPGIAHVWPNAEYSVQDDRTAGLIGATQIWGPTLATAGQGMKIGIIDDGIDQAHPFFNPTGYTYPPGFPKGNTRYTTPKVIVARAFYPAGTTYANAKLPFDPKLSEHGTHVAGIAAGDYDTPADGVDLSGIAPRAYLGNYKALGSPVPGDEPDGNASEIAAAIEAAVRDGMNVINLSIGEIEIEPSRDIVVKALDAAADAGVVATVAAGNDYEDFGHGSIDSPANAPKAIAVAASTGGHGSPVPDRIAPWSSGGPSPYSFEMKPDVTAPGVGVLSSLPPQDGTWDELSGTSMSAPHVAGAAALLMQRHPTWSVEQIKSALVLTGVPVKSSGREVPSTREGGGRIDLVQADQPLVFASPTSLSFKLLRPGMSATRRVALTDAGGGAGTWSAQLQVQGSRQGISFTLPSSVSVPGRIAITARVGAGANQRDVTGFLVLARGSTTRRIPFWFRVERPRLELDASHPISRPGTYTATTIGAPSRVTNYRYPDLSPTTVDFPVHLPGPEVVYRFRLRRPVANLGVVVLGHAPGVNVQPRIVRNGDENQLAGYDALPIDLNPYRASEYAARPVSGVLLPKPGIFDLVFDSPAHARRGTFRFRFWIGDTTPPTVRVLSVGHSAVTVRVTDKGAGVDPTTFHAAVDGRSVGLTYASGIALVSLAGVTPGRHSFVFRVADYQETKNTEDIGPILPNTRTLTTTIRVP